MLNATEAYNNCGVLTRFQGQDRPIISAVMRMFIIRIQVNDLFSILGHPWMISRIGRSDPQGLEEYAKEPGQEDVARHQPCQFLAIFFAVTN